MTSRPNPIGRAGCVCAGCDRSFTSPSAFDKHQRFSPDTGVECREPASVGLEARDKNGVEVWGYPAPDAAQKAAMWGPAA